MNGSLDTITAIDAQKHAKVLKLLRLQTFSTSTWLVNCLYAVMSGM